MVFMSEEILLVVTEYEYYLFFIGVHFYSLIHGHISEKEIEIFHPSNKSMVIYRFMSDKANRHCSVQ